MSDPREPVTLNGWTWVPTIDLDAPALAHTSGDDFTMMGPAALVEGMTIDIPDGEGGRRLFKITKIQESENGGLSVSVEPSDKI